MIKSQRPMKKTMPERNLLQAQKRHFNINHSLSSKHQVWSKGKPQGKKMDVPRPISDTRQFRPHLKSVNTRLKGENLTNDGIYHFNKKMIDFQPLPKIPRAQQRHFKPNPSIQTAENLLKRTMDLNAKYSQQNKWNIHNRPDLYRTTYDPGYPQNDKYNFGKTRIRNKRQFSYDQTRNSIPVSSLGDKYYKHPIYSPGFYNEPGVYPGSTNIDRKRNRAKINMVDFTISKDAKYPFYPTMKYSDRVEMERINLEKKQVEDLDAWEEKLKAGDAPEEEEVPQKKGKKGKKGKGKK